jgi:hypothetical protein
VATLRERLAAAYERRKLPAERADELLQRITPPAPVVPLPESVPDPPADPPQEEPVVVD